jgi:HPt (histidine-containing phosphotransfer) domain-containing protein
MAAVDRIIEEGSHCMNHPLFDEAHYAQLCADITPQSAQEVLQTFLCELADRQAEMSRAHARGDGPGFGKICHAIAGAASMVGAASLAAIASEADGMSKEGRAEAALATFCELETIIARTRDVLASRAAA